MSQMNLFDPNISSFGEYEVKKEAALWHLFVDGASRNNPGQAGAGVYITKDGVLFLQEGFYLGVKTNNEAEYYALLIGLLLIKENMQSSDQLIVVSDSLLVVRQVEGSFKVRKKELLLLRDSAVALMRLCNNSSIQHVLRQKNEYADAMANRGIDTKNPVPSLFLKMLSLYGVTL
jgi:ribonuclease HI